MAVPTSNIRFLILSDTHNIEIDELPETLQNQPRVDVLLHCGDLTYVGGIPSYKRALRLLGTFDAELKLVIAGNHDLSLDGEYWRTHLEEGDSPEEHQQAVNVMTGELAEEMGVTYLTEGLHSFTLRDGRSFTIYCTPYQPWCGDWAFSYKRSEDRFNFDVPTGTTCMATKSSAIPDKVDIMMTHGPPRGMLDLIPSKDEHAGCEALLRAVSRVRPLLHCFGHIHEGYGVQKVDWDSANGNSKGNTKHITAKNAHANDTREFSLKPNESTLMVNAAIMDDNNQPAHQPWIVEVEL